MNFLVGTREPQECNIKIHYFIPIFGSLPPGHLLRFSHFPTLVSNCKLVPNFFRHLVTSWSVVAAWLFIRDSRVLNLFVMCYAVDCHCQTEKVTIFFPVFVCCLCRPLCIKIFQVPTMVWWNKTIEY